MRRMSKAKPYTSSVDRLIDGNETTLTVGVIMLTSSQPTIQSNLLSFRSRNWQKAVETFHLADRIKGGSEPLVLSIWPLHMSLQHLLAGCQNLLPGLLSGGLFWSQLR